MTFYKLCHTLILLLILESTLPLVQLSAYLLLSINGKYIFTLYLKFS
jgi:hypothetical protein